MMIEKVVIQLGAKSLKNSGGAGGGSSCRMMIEKVMIQLGVHFNLDDSIGGQKSKKQWGGWGGGEGPRRSKE